MTNFDEMTQPAMMPAEAPKPHEWTFNLAGVTFENRLAKIARHARRNSAYKLIREPENPYDGNAILVTANGYDIGYVPRKINGIIAKAMDEGIVLKAQFQRKHIDDETGKVVGFMIKIKAV